MNPIFNIRPLYLWAAFLVLLVPFIFVGCKASPNPALLKPGGKYRRPLMALEMDPTGGSRLFKSWNEDTKNELRTALHWDFLFIPIYSLAGAIACLLASRQLGGAEIVRLAFIFSIPAAALFDASENFIMLKVIDGMTSDLFVWIARVSTVCKFALIGVGLIYQLFGLLSWLRDRFLQA